MMQNNGGDGTSEREVGSGTQEAHCQTVTGEVGSGTQGTTGN